MFGYLAWKHPMPGRWTFETWVLHVEKLGVGTCIGAVPVAREGKYGNAMTRTSTQARSSARIITAYTARKTTKKPSIPYVMPELFFYMKK